MARKTTSAKKVKRSGGKSNGSAAVKLESLANAVVEMAHRRKDPTVEIPIRALSNVAYNEKTRHVELGGNKQSRSLFN